MKALVTGGAGFIGSHICTRLIKEGYEVICLDNFDPYYDPGVKRKNIEPLLKDKKFKLVEGDIRDEGLLQDALKG
ncbi:MAG: GDP-mannose 4,6-dehydratase, partial [Dehalococcoidia bacterium]|nr:GDP-mannose 4,6-dehydratase [Dehalococcoidia bacterium]